MSSINNNVAPAAEKAQIRKFESNLGRLLYQQEGETKTHAWTVRVLSVALVLPVALTALSDLVRGLGFLIGNKNPTVAKYFDGKSFSLIDKTSAACKTLSEKVSAAYKTITTPKVLTVEELNVKSEKKLASLAKKLTDGYRAQNGGYFTSNGSFSTPSAISGEKQVRQAQKELIEEMHANLSRNVTDVQDFKAYQQALVGKVNAMIIDAAKDDIFVKNKTNRKGPQPLLSQIATKEFNDSIAAVDSEAFIAVAKQQPEAVKALKVGVEQNVITLVQAKQAVKELAVAAYSENLKDGFDVAHVASQSIVESAVEEKLLSKEEAVSIQINPGVDALAVRASQEVVKAEVVEEVEQDKQLIDKADALIENKVLAPLQKSVFLTEAKKQIALASRAALADLEAQMSAKNKELKAALQAKLAAEEAEAKAEAERVAAVQKAEAQATLLGKFKGMLDLIFEKQKSLSELYATRDFKDAERGMITNLRGALQTEKVTINNKQMTLIEAEVKYNAEIDRISSSKISDQNKKEQIDALVSQGFDQRTINLINALSQSAQTLRAKIEELNDLSSKIDSGSKELAQLNGIYSVFQANNKKGLEKADQAELKGAEETLKKAQKVLDAQYSALRMKAVKPVINANRKENEAEVEALLAQKAQSLIPSAPPLPEEEAVEGFSAAEEAEEGAAEPEVVSEEAQPGRLARLWSAVTGLPRAAYEHISDREMPLF